MTDLFGCEIAALDFETTGLGAEGGDRVIEVAVARGRFGAEPRVWSTLVAPDRPVAATHVHGITDDMLAGQPAFGEVAGTLFAALDGCVVTAHNARFDLRFLRMECGRAGLVPPDFPVLDTLGLSRRLLSLPSHSLGGVTDHFGIARARAHRAADDALATWRVCWALLEQADPARMLELGAAVALCRRPTPEESRRVRAILLAAGERAEPILIDYQGAPRPGGAQTRRAILVHRVTTNRVEAFCQLRGEERSFRLDRIRLV